ncbi:hypothetical protein FQN54_007057 [Arachnomyces sp. PD_36]|nr:hypothetical protein FQN54_007057 [Arachnomyces sp. PD_36]
MAVLPSLLTSPQLYKVASPCDRAKDNIYCPLDSSRSEFRLVQVSPERDGELCCSIYQASLKDSPKYTAISYTWGSPDRKYSIRLNGKLFVVRQNLHDVLETLRRESEATSLWWIDAICIDQGSRSERNHQVSLMKFIYEKASTVLVWLGPGRDGSDDVMRWVKSMYDHRSDEDWLRQQFQAVPAVKTLSDLCKLFQRPYWNRIWIVQEIVCGGDIVLFCGQESAPAAAFEFVQRAFIQMKSEGVYICNALFPEDPDTRVTIGWRGLRPIWNSRMSRAQSDLRIFDALRYHYTKLSTDPRDKIYGLIGLRSSEEPGINIDYDCTTAQVYTRYFKYEVQITQKLDILIFASAASRRKENPLQAPSWVPDWTYHRIGHARLLSIFEPHFQFTASGPSESKVSFHDPTLTLTVRGIQIAHVAAIGEATGMSHRADAVRATTAFRDWSEHLFDKSPLDEPAKEVSIARSLLANRFRAEEYADFGDGVTDTEFLRGLLGAWAEELQIMFSDGRLHRLLTDCLEFKRSRFSHSTEHARVWRLWVEDSMKYILDRRLFVSSNGEFGLAPEETEVGDVVCVPLGCPLPMILWHSREGHTVVGEAYVDGWMYGKALDLLHENAINAKDFVLI